MTAATPSGGSSVVSRMQSTGSPKFLLDAREDRDRNFSIPCMFKYKYVVCGFSPRVDSFARLITMALHSTTRFQFTRTGRRRWNETGVGIMLSW